MFQESLESILEVLPAYSIPEAEQLFSENPDLQAIAMDACVPGGKPNTLFLARKFRDTFGGPMIAISNDFLYRSQLLEAGCSHQCEKYELPKLLKMIFDR